MESIRETRTEAAKIISSLCDSLSGDLKLLVLRIVGRVGNGETSETSQTSEICDTSAEVAQDGAWAAGSRSTEAGPAAKPASNPLGWVPDLLAVCCEAYSTPAVLSAPVSACLVLLGIASSVFDAAQDGHTDLLSAYGLDSGHAASRSNAPGTSEKHSFAVLSNAGLTLTGLAWQALFVYGPRYYITPETLFRLGEVLLPALVRVCEAQHLDLTLAARSPQYVDESASPLASASDLPPSVLSLEEYGQLIEGKAGLISAVACETAFILSQTSLHTEPGSSDVLPTGSCDPRLPGKKRSRELWRTIGLEREIAKQLWDDYLDLDDDIKSGRQAGQAVLYSMLVASPEQASRLTRLLAEGRGDHAGAAEARKQVLSLAIDLGAEYYLLASLAAHRNKAFLALDELCLPEPQRHWVGEWILRIAPTRGATGMSA